jgi:hypothetical protein
MVKQRLDVGIRSYELRYTICHRRNCTTCYGRQEDYCGPPGHGPYWYLCVVHARRWTRIYIGKTLDTTKFILADGAIDWATIKARATARRATHKKTKEAPDHAPTPTGNTP